jgi:DNA-binding CsgD family transcriptional regulator
LPSHRCWLPRSERRFIFVLDGCPHTDAASERRREELRHPRVPKDLPPGAPRSELARRSDAFASTRLKWATARIGFVLLDSSGRIVHANSDARRILSYSAARRRGGEHDRAFAKDVDRLLASFPNLSTQAEWSTDITSGNRRYRCRAFVTLLSGERHTVLLIERTTAKLAALARLFDEYHFTPREQQAARLLAEGLTNKEIAARMGVSVNTVKAFIRSVMIKVGVSTRTGIIGRLTQRN